MKKMMTIAEVELIRLEANDMICTSGPFDNLDPTQEITNDDENNIFAPSRYNYRGAAIDWDDQDW